MDGSKEENVHSLNYARKKKEKKRKETIANQNDRDITIVTPLPTTAEPGIKFGFIYSTFIYLSCTAGASIKI